MLSFVEHFYGIYRGLRFEMELQTSKKMGGATDWFKWFLGESGIYHSWYFNKDSKPHFSNSIAG